MVDFDPRKRQKWKSGRKGAVRPQTLYARKVRVDGHFPDWVPGAALATGIAILAVAMLTSPIASSIGCGIKGNVSFGGERIYHVPGQEYYSETIINPLQGERWFCSEEAAREAGWRKAYR
ncbi:hypothetical protein [Sinorhizobium terangae]|uniref:sunset domain-containing protein n=1 Tax=Sinorhizobium terangae TaxID=110322 RepID=UPI0024B19F1B|nr:hypothetical protein [Sinorhizobium terangae]WFU50734.1 hypothetical protein QA637_19025 [Sinorhizobium terangae]